MQSEAESARQSKRLSSQYAEYVTVTKRLWLSGTRTPYSLPRWVQSASNTPSEMFWHGVADTEDSQATTTHKGKPPGIQIMKPTAMKPLGRLSADPDSEEAESEPLEDEPKCEAVSPHPKIAIKYLQSLYQELYPAKD